MNTWNPSKVNGCNIAIFKINLASELCSREKFKLVFCRDVDIDVFKDPQRVQEASRNLKDLGSLEECVCRWMRQISLVRYCFELVTLTAYS